MVINMLLYNNDLLNHIDEQSGHCQANQVLFVVLTYY